MSKRELPHTEAVGEKLPDHALYSGEAEMHGAFGDLIADIARSFYDSLKKELVTTPATEEKPVILCIDDEKMIHIALSDYISRSNCVPACAKSAKEAQKILKKVRPNLILLDIFMPGDDSLALLKYFKEKKRLRDIPVIIVTGMNDTDLIAKYLEAGAMDYFLKPLINKQETLAPLSQTETPQKTAGHLVLSDHERETVLTLLRCANKRLEKTVNHDELSDEVIHDLNNVLLGLSTIHKIIADK
ncbi:response regulator [Mariprofundus erugo]|uniref:response regulator n=1 Tax=Mariprofundus erugo TaxID=2528639 RepID=UPI0010FDD88D|nr:response regulator [Mariprofundus erugo]TLS77242.1 response regulator [Mariprofundus erugo]